MTEVTEGAAEAVAEDTTLVPEVVEDVPADEAGAAAEPEAEAPQPKPKKTAQERFDELTREKHEARREADYWREQAMRTTPAPATPEPKADEEPDPANYTYGEADVAYLRAQAKYEARITVRQELEQERTQTRLQSQIATFDQRAAQIYPDGEPAGLAAFKRIERMSTAVQDVILASENGPKLADHLGSNPAELRRLSGLAPALQAYELAKLESKLTAKQPKTISTAPDPAPQVRGAGGQFKVAPDTEDFAAFKQAYTR